MIFHYFHVLYFGINLLIIDWLINCKNCNSFLFFPSSFLLFCTPINFFKTLHGYYRFIFILIVHSYMQTVLTVISSYSKWLPGTLFYQWPPRSFSKPYINSSQHMDYLTIFSQIMGPSSCISWQLPDLLLYQLSVTWYHSISLPSSNKWPSQMDGQNHKGCIKKDCWG